MKIAAKVKIRKINLTRHVYRNISWLVLITNEFVLQKTGVHSIPSSLEKIANDDKHNKNNMEDRFSIECRKTKSKVITLGNHKEHTQNSEPIKTPRPDIVPFISLNKLNFILLCTYIWKLKPD